MPEFQRNFAITSIFKAKRLIFQQKPGETIPQSQSGKDASLDKPGEKVEKPVIDREKAADHTADALTTTPDIKQKAKSYYEVLIAKKSPEKQTEIDKLREKIESDQVSAMELQGGWEFMGLNEKEHTKKFGKLSEIYLDTSTDTSGNTIFTVKSELDQNYKTKYGIGAGDLLPPSITTVTITDLNGSTQIGTRKIINDRIGYYTTDGKYIAIFSGYKIKPIDLIDENSEEFKKTLDDEKSSYEIKAAAAKAYEDGVSKTDPDTPSYIKRTNYPVSTLQSLRTSTPEDLKSKKTDAKEIARIDRTKLDLQRIEALLDNFGIRMDMAKSEITGGLYLTELDGKGASMLGWENANTEKETELFTKLSDKKYLDHETEGLKDGEEKQLTEGLTIIKNSEEKDGYTFKDSRGRKVNDLRSWCINQAAKSTKPNQTAEFIKSLQKGGENNKFLGHKFSGNYDFDITHLDAFHKLATKNPEDLKRILEQAGKNKTTIASTDVIKEIFKERVIPAGMDMKTAEAFINKNRDRLGFLLGDNGQIITLRDLYKLSGNKSPLGSLTYRWDALRQQDIYPVNGGERCCAWTVSTFIGMGDAGARVQGKEGNVRHLVARLMSSNRAKSGNDGIVFGFENYEPGDVLMFKGYKDYAYQKFGHVAVVRSKLDIPVYDQNGRHVGTEKYLVILDEGKHLQANIVPVNRGSRTQSFLAKALGNPSTRQAYLDRHPELKEVYAERKYVNIKANAGWWGDALTGPGNVAFAIRTKTLTSDRDKRIT